MPRYSYMCFACHENSVIFHGFKDFPEECPLCGSYRSLSRNITKPSIKKGGEAKKKVGSLVKKHIEETKEEVKREKKRIKSEDYKV